MLRRKDNLAVDSFLLRNEMAKTKNKNSLIFLTLLLVLCLKSEIQIDEILMSLQ